MSIVLTDQQAEAIKLIEEWYSTRTKIHQIFTLAGYAGTGKTFLIDYLVKNTLGLDMDDIAFVAPTGKAASQLTKKGLKAITVHKLIYVVEEIETPETDDDGNLTYDDDGKIISKKHLKFKKRDELDVDYKLIIVDEVSMVDEHILQDICSFDIPILAVGDSGQLPAIMKGHTLLEKPDYNLTEVVRQALDDPIIAVATDIRLGKYVPTGKYGDNVVVASRKYLSDSFIDELLKEFDQVICGTNATRKKLNNKMRKINGIDIVQNPRPVIGDKMICVSNNWSIEFGENNIYSLVNGMIGYVDDVNYEPSEHVNVMYLDFKPDFAPDSVIQNLVTDPGIFVEPYEYSFKLRQLIYKGVDGRLSIKDFNVKKMKNEKSKDFSSRLLNDILNRHAKEEVQINRFEYGYAITCHKSQGSEWDSVLVFDQSFIMKSDLDRRRWLYTAVTRSKKRLIILR